jgi:hypothetical protein
MTNVPAKCHPDRPVVGRGLCNYCWKRAKADGTLSSYPTRYGTLDERLARYVPPRDPAECWPWGGPVNNEGYGVLILGGRKTRQALGAHRFMFERLREPIPDDLELDHLCHTNDPGCPGGKTCPHRRCVNPDHLEPVPGPTNVLRGRSIAAANAVKDSCPEGHPYDYVDAEGHRRCRRCTRRIQREATARYRARKRAKAAATSQLAS